MVKYIGCNDYDLQLFESQYPVPCGMAYNSYLILDEKIAVLDTVDARKAEEWKHNLQEALEGRTPDYLVVQHLEPDHSALIKEVLDTYPQLQLILTQKALQMLPQFFEGISLDGKTLVVKEGDTLCLGHHTLQFFMAPMVHWPEVMVSYEQTDKLLFSADAFGSFGTLDQQEDDWACEARRYYFNICGKYGNPVQTLLKKLKGLEVDTIYSLHGPALSGTAKDKAIQLYDTWSKYEAEKEGVYIGYASIHGGTAKVAEFLAKILQEKGVKVCLMDLTREEVSFAVEDAFAYGKAIFCASSYDAGLFPPMYNLLHHLQEKSWQNKRVALVENGSWAPSAGRVMREMLQTMKQIDLVEPIVTIKSRMKQTDIPALQQLAEELIK